MESFLKFIFVLSLFTSTAHAIDRKACSDMLNNGLYKTYKYGGIDQPLTQATKDHGISKATSVTSTEGTTALLDPKYWSNITTSETQSTSSWGDCNALALNQLQEQRRLYLAQNHDEILHEIAKGHGEHINVLATYSLCDKSAYEAFGTALQENIKAMMDNKKQDEVIDSTVKNSKTLAQSCYSYSV